VTNQMSYANPPVLVLVLWSEIVSPEILCELMWFQTRFAGHKFGLSVRWRWS